MTATRKDNQQGDSVKPAAQHFTNIHSNIKRLHALGEDYEASNRFDDGSPAVTEYATSLRKFADEVKTTLETQKAANSQMVGALQTLKTEPRKIYEAAVSSPSTPWTQASWDAPFKEVEKQLTELSKANSTSETKTFVAAKLQELETLRGEEFNKVAAELDNSVARQLTTNSHLKRAMEFNEALPLNLQYSVSSSSDKNKRNLFEPLALEQNDEEELKREEEKNDAVLKSIKTEEDERRRKMKQLQASTGKYYRCKSGPCKNVLYEYSAEGCKPVSGKLRKEKGTWRWIKDKVTGSTEFTKEKWGGAMDLMRFKEGEDFVMTYSNAIVSKLAKDENERMKEEVFGTFRKTFTASYIKKEILPAFEAAKERKMRFELDSDLRNYMTKLQWDNSQKIRPDKSLDKAIAEVLKQDRELRNAAEKEKILGRNRDEMKDRVNAAKDKLEAQSGSNLKAAYDRERENLAAMNPGIAAIGSAPPKPEEELSEEEKLAKQEAKQDADAISALNTKSPLIDPNKPVDQKAELIKQELEVLGQQHQAAVDAEILIAGQVAALNQKIKKEDPFFEEHMDKLDGLRTVQQQKLEELAVKAKMLQQTAQSLTGLAENEHAQLVEKTTKRVQDIVQTETNSKVNLKAAVVKPAEKQEASHVAAPGGPAP